MQLVHWNCVSFDCRVSSACICQPLITCRRRHRDMCLDVTLAIVAIRLFVLESSIFLLRFRRNLHTNTCTHARTHARTHATRTMSSDIHDDGGELVHLLLILGNVCQQVNPNLRDPREQCPIKCCLLVGL